MTKKLLTLFFMLFISETLHAKVFSLEKTFNYNTTPHALLAPIIDYENYCSKNCKYQISNLDKMIIVERSDDSHLYTWTRIVNGFKTYEYFSQVEVKEDSNGVIEVISTTPDNATVNRLKNQYKLGYRPFFSFSRSVWTLKPSEDHTSTVATFENRVEASGFIVNLFSSVINQSLQTSAVELDKALRSTLN